jgi:diacylglycerol kinase (ATP)
MAGQNLKGFARIYAAFFHSVRGYKATWVHEEAFRQEVYLFIIAGPLGLWIGETPVEKVLLSGSIILVMIVELLNTGIEIVVDRISFERHELSGRAKDVGSAAVLSSLALAGITWGLILYPRFGHLLAG